MENEIKVLTIKEQASVNISEHRSAMTQIISGSEISSRDNWNQVDTNRSKQSLSSSPHSIRRDSKIY